MEDAFSRTRRLIGGDALYKLSQSRVAVFGVGGVGGYVAEALARGGVGALDLIDGDVVSLSNLNRQLIALRSTIGQFKTEVMANRIRDINPDCVVRCHQVFYLPDNAQALPLDAYDYVVDAVDTVAAKLCLIETAIRLNVPVISAMGAGNKLDPGCFQIADLSETSVCPLCRVMRRELRRRSIEHVTVCYSKEEPIAPDAEGESGRIAPGSMSFVPGVAGLMIAGRVIRDLAGM